jgi:hypothetical protein
MKRGCSAESPSVSLRWLTTLFRPRSKSTKVSAPQQPSSQLLARDQLARVLQQRQQQLKGLIAERRSTIVVGQFAGTSIDGERPEVVDTRGLDAIRHRFHPGEPA